MKKYLKTGFAVLAIGAAFVSCSHDIEPLSQEEIDQIEILKINAKYEQASIKTFGKPASNQDWGFGDKAKTRAIGDYKTKGTMTASFTFPTDCDASKFNPDLTNIPSYDEYCATLGNANWTPDEFACGEVYIDKVQKVHIWGEYGKRAKLYIKEGTYDFSNETFDLCADADLYLLPNAKVTLGNTAASTAKFDIYIAEGAELIENGQDGFRADVDAHVYNHGTITCSRFEVNGTSFLYNVGKLESSGDVYIANSTSYIVNDGEVESASVHVEGSGALQNNAEWTVSGNTIVNCTNGGWVNNGHWITENYGYTAGSENVINNCFLEVTEDFDMNISSSNSDAAFKIDTGGGVLTKNFNGGKVIDDPESVSGPYKIVMGHSAVFKVTGTATLEGGNPGWGFFGPADGDYAVFQAKNVVRDEDLAGTQGAVTYSGQLYVSAETHFAQGHDGMDAEGHYFINEWNGFSVDTNIYAEGFKAGKPSVTIEETSCCPGFDGGEDADLRIIAEDLSAGEVGDDFDFNDVVIDVYYGDAGQAKAKILAAGGTLDLKVDGNEVHNEFSKANNNVDCAGKMINTNGTQSSDAKVRSRSLDGLTAPVITLSKEVKTPVQARDNIDIQVLKTVNGEKLWISLEAVIGKVASKVRVGTDYQWKNERQYVGDNFKDFVTGAAGYADWYKQD